MNFIEAVKLAKEGNNIRRSYWHPTQYIKIINHLGIQLVLCWEMDIMIGAEIQIYIPDIESILANDWVIKE